MLERGTQIKYVPNHINLRSNPALINSNEIEYGFITAVVNDIAMCRFWRHGAVDANAVTMNDLRTRANGEWVSLSNLSEFILVSPNDIKRVMAEIAPTPRPDEVK